jgi:hypothetical protein
VSEIAAFVNARLDEREAWAKAASELREPGTPTGEHWRWECENCDTPIAPDPAVDEFLYCPRCGSYGVGLRSVERYPTESVGALSSFIVSGAEEQPPAAAQHIALNDPQFVLADIAAKRRILSDVYEPLREMESAIQDENDTGEDPSIDWHEASNRLLCLLAAPFAAHSDYDPAWRLP